MKLYVFVSKRDLYDYFELDTDKLLQVCPTYVTESKPSIFLDELIEDLIDKN